MTDTQPASDNAFSPRFLLGFTLAVLLAGFLLMGTRNGFSYQAHPDESSKVAQILSHSRNFRHPLLLLNSVQLAVDVSGLTPTPQSVVRAGRFCSALFTSLAVLALALTAAYHGGRPAALLCAGFLLCTPLLLELGHYFKEDPALLMGLAVVFLAIAMHQHRARTGAVCLMAVGFALAASGKHLGILVLPFCLYTLRKDGPRALLLFSGIAVGLYGLINWQALIHASEVAGGLNREVVAIRNGGTDGTPTPPWYFALSKYWGVLKTNSPLPLLLLCGYGVAVSRGEKTRNTLSQILVFAGLLAVVLCSSPKASARYFLPLAALLCVPASVGAARALAHPEKSRRLLWGVLPVTLALALLICKSRGVLADFRRDHRKELAHWITLNLPADAVVAQDPRAGLTNPSLEPDGAAPVPQRLVTPGSLATTASLDALRALGAQYLVVRASDFPAANAKTLKDRDSKGLNPSLDRELATTGKPLWSADLNNLKVPNLRVDLQLYRIAPEGSLPQKSATAPE